MPNLSITRTVVDATVFTQAQNETQMSDIETWANTTKLDSSNLQNGAVVNATLANGVVDSTKLAAASVGTANIIDANVTTAKYADNSVTGAKLNSNTVDNATLQYTASQLSLKDAGTTAAKFAADALALMVPTGAVLPYVAALAPSGFLICNGAAVSRTTYAALFTLMGITHGQGDGATTFNVPDYRGYFLRGYDHGAGNDPDAASRTAIATGGNTGDNIGTVQTSANLAHTHTVQQGAIDGNLQLASGIDHSFFNTGVASGSSGGTESRPKNITVQFIIKT